jgi:uncharacterized SAM-binding protein YcdF (DUF218 family)
MSDLPAVPRRRWPRGVLLLLALLAILYMVCGWLLLMAVRFLDVSEPPRAVDAVLVLGGGADTRPFVAAALVRSGLVHRVLVPTVRPSSESEDGLPLSEDELIRRVLQARGVPDETVVMLPGKVDSTRDEARALGRFLEVEPNTSVAVVTNSFHTRRARMLFRHVLGERMAQVHFIGAPTDRFNAADWWRQEEEFSCYASEYLKLVYYGLREDRSWQMTVLLVTLLGTGLWWCPWRKRA